MEELDFFRTVVGRYPALLYVGLYLVRSTAYGQRASLAEDMRSRSGRLFEEADESVLQNMVSEIGAKAAEVISGMQTLFQTSMEQEKLNNKSARRCDFTAMRKLPLI